MAYCGSSCCKLVCQTSFVVLILYKFVGPVANVHLPKDRVTTFHQGYAFCEFATEQDADYAVRVKLIWLN